MRNLFNHFLSNNNRLGLIAVSYVVFIMNGCNPVSVEREYYESGKLKTERSFVLGIENGFYRVYSEDGTLMDSMAMSDGYMNGIAKSYYPNGRTQWAGIFKDGKKNGYYIEYYENGRIHSKEFFKEDMPDSIWQEYDTNGVFSAKLTFKNGKPIERREKYSTGYTKRILYSNEKRTDSVWFDPDSTVLVPSSAIMFHRKGTKNSDTITLGEQYKIDIVFIEHNLSSLKNKHIIIGSLSPEGNLMDITRELPIIDNFCATYTETPWDLGDHLFTGVLRYTKANGKVINAPFIWKYYVRPKRGKPFGES